MSVSPERDVIPGSPLGLLHPSNLLTYLALLCATAGAVAATVFHNVPTAGAAMALAVIADTFDGKFARLFRRTAFQSEFGVQLDSLADSITSGFVPVIVLATTAGDGSRGAAIVWAIAATGYIVAALTRLGYYNLTQASGPFFVGLPAPAATLIVSTALLWRPSVTASAIVLACCAAAMVSAVRIPRPRGIALGLFAAWAVVLVVLHVASIN